MQHSIIRQFFPLALVILVVCGGSRTGLEGYATGGHTWGTNQVLYYINPQNIYMSDSAAISGIQTGALGWSSQTLANIQLVYAGYTSGSSLTANKKNEVFFRNDSNGYIAETYWWYDGTGHLVDADVVFHQGYHFFTGSGCSGGIYLEDSAIHEFGHALGLEHSSVSNATMAPAMPSYCDLTQLSLESDDIAGIESLYPPSSSKPVNTAPTVSIASPSSGLGFAAGATITFAGSATDSQDGDLTASLSWTSSIDGVIGSGSSFSRTLSAGTHVITASVRDSAGVNGSSQTTIGVASASSTGTSSVPSLTARGYKVRGWQKADLRWSGFGNATVVNLFRDRNLIATVPGSSGTYTDSLSKKGPGSYTYVACGGDPYVCSSSVTVGF